MEEIVANGQANASSDSRSHAKKMTIGEISTWLTEHGREEVVWNLKQNKAKKDAFVAAYLDAQQ